MLVLQEKEFLKMFKMPVIEVPTNLPNIQVDLPIQAFAVSFWGIGKYNITWKLQKEKFLLILLLL